MVMVDIEPGIYEKVKNIVEQKRIDYPTIKNFVDKALREKVFAIQLKDEE